ncbi:MAG: hypothetical protein R3C32_11440 [Chloroflexota bacterium]
MTGAGPVPLAPGMRTTDGRGPGAALGAAAQAVASSPRLWLLGSWRSPSGAGWCSWTLPILTLPSLVLLSILFRDEIGTAGPTPALQAAAIVPPSRPPRHAGRHRGLAWCDLLAFEAVTQDDATLELRLGRTARLGAARGSVLLWLTAIQAAAVLPLLLLAMVVPAASRVVTSQVQRPTGHLHAAGAPGRRRPGRLSRVGPGDGRDPGGAGEPRFPTAARGARGAAARRARRAVRDPARGGRRPPAGPTTLREMGVALVSWGVAVLAAVAGVVSVSVAWAATRPGLQALATSGDTARLAAAPVALALLCAVWLAVLCLCGCATAFRTAVWTMDALR